MALFQSVSVKAQGLTRLKPSLKYEGTFNLRTTHTNPPFLLKFLYLKLIWTTAFIVVQ